MKKGSAVSLNMGLLNFIMFALILLKLTDVIAWSWWIILFPLILQAGLAVVILFMIVLATFIVSIQEIIKK